MAKFSTEAEIRDTILRERERTAYPSDLAPIPPMPAQRYSDPEFYKLELEHVFGKSWLPAGHISELPKTGSYKLFEELGYSVIISRGVDDEIRAFKNACRHRAAALVSEKHGTARRFVCPYHSWGFSTDGTLKSVPEPQNFACLKKEELSLVSVRCEIWRGFIYINFDNDAEPLADFLAPVAAQVVDFPFEDMVVKGLVVKDIDCNWKLGYDNFLESYHINTVHRKTIAPYIDCKTWTAQLLPGGHACMRTMKRNSDTLFRSENISSEGKSGDAELVQGAFRDITFAIPRFPNGAAGLDPAGFNWQSFWPTGPGTARIVNLILGTTHGTPEEDAKYWSDFADYNCMILAEDCALFGSMQRSISQGDITEVHLATQEQVIQWYNQQIDLKIGIERVPEHLRVAQVLTPSDA